jgi:hypothetical protein
MLIYLEWTDFRPGFYVHSGYRLIGHLAATLAGFGYVAVIEPTHRKSVICHRGRRESFSGFKQAPSGVSFLCQAVTDFDRFSVKY